MTDDDRELLAKIELDWGGTTTDKGRLLKMIRERDAEIVRLKAKSNQQGADYTRLYMDTFPLHKLVEAARDTLEGVAAINCYHCSHIASEFLQTLEEVK